MAEQILTQVEVDALLKGLSNGDIKTEAEKLEEDDTEPVRAYDFSNQERSVRGRMPALEMINEKFCRSIRSSLFNLLRKSVDTAPEGVKTMKYEEFLRNLQVPCSLNVFQMSTLRGQGVLAIDPNLVFLIVDSYFGGDGRFHTRIEGRDFTNVEQAVIRKVAELILHEMSDIWRPVHATDFKLVRAEMNPQFVNILGHNEHLVVSTFRMELESQSNQFFFCIPFSAVEPIREKLYGGAQRVDSAAIDKRWSANLLEQFGYVPLTISGQIGKARIKMSELWNLKAGDVIQLDKKAREPLDVSIEGVPKLTASAGTMDNNYALKILAAINERG
ncbi:MAG: flagellar motor switch protein FliM [Deltaproteobacteria bacterium]|nr:flagellar motor switch protein FliM [Deltaproteobacteria bacterium]